MTSTKHKVAGVYSDRDAAREGVRTLREAGFSEEEVILADREDWRLAFTDPEEIGRRSRRGVWAGAGTGAGIGAAAAGILAAAEVGVVAAAPLVSVLAGAGLGALAGTAVAGISSPSVHEPDFRNMVREAVNEGHSVVIVRASNESEALEAQNLIAQTTDRSLDQYGTMAH